jgi:hypothetical protein
MVRREVSKDTICLKLISKKRRAILYIFLFYKNRL